MQVYRSYRARAAGRSRGVEMTDPNARSSAGLSAVMTFLSSPAVTLPRGVLWRERTNKQRLTMIPKQPFSRGCLWRAVRPA
jgi:hypothetical protein